MYRSDPHHLPLPAPQTAADAEFAAAVERFVQHTVADNPTVADSAGRLFYRLQSIVERVLLRDVLRHVGGNQVEAARILGISRTTLRSKLRRWKSAAKKESGR